jgi:hypothetical protein
VISVRVLLTLPPCPQAIAAKRTAGASNQNLTNYGLDLRYHNFAHVNKNPYR